MTRSETVVLVVSDDPELRANVRGDLVAAGWDAAEADADAAAMSLPDAGPSAVVFDFGPGRGRAFAAVQSAAVTYSVPVIALAAPSLGATALALGADAVATAEELLAVVEALITTTAAPPPPSSPRASPAPAAPSAEAPDPTDHAAAEALWARVGAYLRTQLPPDVWARWFAGLRATSLGPNALTLTAPDAAHRDLVAHEYGAWLEELVSNATKGGVQAVVVTS